MCGKSFLGAILCSVGVGMLLVIFVPGWSFFTAIIFVGAGGVLLCSSKR